MSAAAMSLPMHEDLAEPSRASRWFLLIAAAVSIGLGAWMVLQISSEEVVRLHIEAPLLRVSADEIEQTVRAYIDVRFTEVDLAAVQRAVVGLPWVARVRVERVWPATVRLRVWEREPIAYWNGDQLLDREAVAFAPELRSLPEGLPRLSGPSGSAALVVARYKQLTARLHGTPFELTTLSQDKRGDWTAGTVSSIELRFGRTDPSRALDVLLGPVIRALAERLDEVEHVDLRYTNGFSVGWRQTPAPEQRTKHGTP